MTAQGLGEKQFTPEHAFAILVHQHTNHHASKSCWTITSPEWKFEGGKLTLTKNQNENKSDTGIGDETPKRKRDTTGSDPQP